MDKDHQAEKVEKLKLVFIGAGWVGGLTSSVMAEYWPEHSFYVYDISAQQISRWNSEELPFYEESLSEIVAKVRGKNLFFTANKTQAFENADLFIICVNTPTKSKGLGAGEIHDLKYLESCTRDLASYFSDRQMQKPIAIVEKSTVGPTTSDIVKNIFCSHQQAFPDNKNKFCVMSNPEFLAEGVAVRDLRKPDRVIIGSDQDELSKTMESRLKGLYARFVPQERIICTTTYTSEFSKIVSNAFLAQRVSSINSLTPICEKIGIQVDDISKCVGSDSRIGPKYLSASIGFGGSCLEKDLMALVYLARSLGLEEVADYWKGVVSINSYQKNRLSRHIVKTLNSSISGKVISLFGVAFKAGTSDCRGSAAISVAQALLEEGATLQIYDPQVIKGHFFNEYFHYTGTPLSREEQDKVSFCHSALGAVENSHAIVILTEWPEFKTLDYASLCSQMMKPAYVFDYRGMVDQKTVGSLGFKVFKIGSG